MILSKSRVFFCILLVLYTVSALGQSIHINGSVSDSGGNKIHNATVTLFDSQDKVLFYKFSGADGKFTFHFPDSTKFQKIVKLEINLFGYKKISADFLRENYDFILEEKVNELDEIKIISRVTNKGDTTAYNVQAFKSPEDRSIGDVISRLPGMSVAEDGTIKYRNKELKGLYIHGDDLMQERYGLATKAITHDKIKSIQVIERFQPVRVLKNKVFTDDVAINLILNDENALKMSGSAMLGVGIPNLLDIGANSMLFNAKTKTINLAKYNNAGESYPVAVPRDILSDATVGNPDVPDKYFNRNRSGIISANYLRNLRDTLQLKVHSQFITDNRLIDYSSVDKNYLVEGDTITFIENQLVNRKPRLFTSSLSFERNKASKYLKNVANLKLGVENNVGNLEFNESAFDQNLRVKNVYIGNDFHWIPVTKNRNTYNLKWNTSYQKRPQNLGVYTGIDSLTLNGGASYNAVFQNVEKASFKNQLLLEYFVNDKKKLKKSFLSGVLSEFETLSSAITLEQNDGSLNFYKDDVGNNLNWHLNRQYVSANFQIEDTKFRVNLQLPIIHQKIRFKQVDYDMDEKLTKLFFNPSLTFRYFLNSNNYINAFYFLTNNFGTINNVYRGLVLTNFRGLNSNTGNIQESQVHRMGLSYTYRDAISMLDCTIGANYSIYETNTTYAKEYQDNIVKTVLLPYANKFTVSQYEISFSKYIDLLRTKFELTSMHKIYQSNQFVNEIFLPYVNKNLAVNLKGGIRWLNYVSLNYIGSANWFWGGQSDKGGASASDTRFSIYNHQYSIVAIPKENFNLVLQLRQQQNHSEGLARSSYIFTDLKMKYNIHKIRTELEGEVNNIFDVSRFESYSLLANQFHSTNYQLRGRMFLIKATLLF